MVYTLPSEIFSLEVGRRWTYTTGAFIFSREVSLKVVDKKNNRYLVVLSTGDLKVSAIIQSDVDLSLVAMSNTEVNTLDDESSFEIIPRVEILKSPIVTGASWENSMGSFKIIDSDYKLKLNKNVYTGCIYLQLKDTSNAYNDIYIKPGTGIIFASIFADGFGKIYLNLKQKG